jgi:hypothetical protein
MTSYGLMAWVNRLGAEGKAQGRMIGTDAARGQVNWVVLRHFWALLRTSGPSFALRKSYLIVLDLILMLENKLRSSISLQPRTRARTKIPYSPVPKVDHPHRMADEHKVGPSLCIYRGCK